MTTNEAAERLRIPDDVLGYLHDGQWFTVEHLDARLAAERRATVERIRAALTDPRAQHTSARISAILDEEAAR